ncbi:cupin domain-containing protein [Streptomyces sp. NPDC059605]|uniref:cupin domain-containing protein n=1 Tax=unclassified Streptomyces TaxID=2593676 RepID=UPI0036AFD0D2
MSPEAATAVGFVPLSAPRTPVEESGGPRTGHVRRLYGSAVAGPSYYGQTTHFTCGAVAVLVAQAHQVPLDELVGAPEVGDPRIRVRPRVHRGRTVIPLSAQAGGVQAWKSIIPAGQNRPEPVTHEGYEWLYVLSGRLRLVLADHDMVMGPGEAAEFDTRLPHRFGPAEDSPVEILNLFGPQGERVHVRARPRSGRRRPSAE